MNFCQREETMSKERVLSAYKDGQINSYMAERLLKAMEYGMTDDLVEEAVDDAQYASDLGVTSDDDYNLYFFTKTCVPDMLIDTFGLNPKECDQKDLCAFILDHSKDESYDLKNLVDHRLLIHKWLCDKMDKRAYPNIGGKDERMPERDLDKWVSTLKDIYASVHKKKMGRNDAFNYFTADWDADERNQFYNWMQYYESDTPEKYNVKNASTKLVKEALIPQSWMSPQDRQNAGPEMSTYQQPAKTDREVKMEQAMQFKRQMKSRLRSLRRLVDRYNEALPHQELTAIYKEMNDLELSIARLNAYASIQDVIIRSANRIRKMGFKEGADFLITAAEEGVKDEDITDVLPAPTSDQPNLQPGSRPQVHINTIINRLEGTSKILKSRDMIRELASIDILLNELGIASHFPELTDAQAKLIESFGYASNKIESIVAKLRGSGTARPSPVQQQATPAPAAAAPAPVAPKPEKVDTEALHTKPMGKVQKELPKE